MGNGAIGGGRTRKVFGHSFNEIVSVDNLLLAWQEFLKDKRAKRDVQEFGINLMDNLWILHEDLIHHTYHHSPYQAFSISDPRPRNIHKATVRDRLLHHAIHRVLYPFFDKTFVYDSYSCRLNKGTHKAIDRFRRFTGKASCNHTRTCWILKCDIRKFFASINQNILLDIIKTYIPDQDIIWLLSQVIGSFCSTGPSIGLPLGNLTSQLLANIYMNEFDQFVKHNLKVKYYIRYADDFVILSADKSWLEELLHRIGDFLWERLHLELHPDKVFIRTLSSGMDFLGWVHFPKHRVLRTATKKRMLRVLAAKSDGESVVQSYLGLLSHGNARKLQRKINRTGAITGIWDNDMR